MSVLDYVILGIVIAWFIAALIIIISNWKKGKKGCCSGGSCDGCCEYCKKKCKHKKEND